MCVDIHPSPKERIWCLEFVLAAMSRKEVGTSRQGAPPNQKALVPSLTLLLPCFFSISLLFSFSDVSCFFVRFSKLFQGF